MCLCIVSNPIHGLSFFLIETRGTITNGVERHIKEYVVLLRVSTFVWYILFQSEENFDCYYQVSTME